jgi:transposase-like protein
MTIDTQQQTPQSRTIPLPPTQHLPPLGGGPGERSHRARILYLTTGMSHRAIAEEVGVSERTVFTWVHKFGWERLRIAALQAPATIIENFTSELVEMQNAIKERDLGKRFPDNKEADVMRKLMLCIGGAKNTTSLSQNMQMMECFRDFVRPLDKEFTQQLAHYADKFYSAKAINGYAPYTVQYAAAKNIIATPFYDELDGTEAIPIQEPPVITTPCINFSTCTAEHCKWPKCKYPSPIKADEATLEADKPWAPLTDSEAEEAAIRNWYAEDEIAAVAAILQQPENDPGNKMIINTVAPETTLPETPQLPEASGSNPATLQESRRTAERSQQAGHIS